MIDTNDDIPTDSDVLFLYSQWKLWLWYQSIADKNEIDNGNESQT